MAWKKRSPQIAYLESDHVITKLAKIRGIKSTELDRYMNPTSKELHSPFLMKNIEIASERIVEAIRKNQRIAISNDCDTDGVCGMAQFVRYLRDCEHKNYYVTHNERSRGHGVHNQLDKIENGTELLVIIDSSSTEDSKDAIFSIISRGIDVIILDHHDVEVDYHDLIPRVIMVNPQQIDCFYPNKHISGSTVVYKTLQMVDDIIGMGTVDDYLDLVAVGMYADVMRVDVLENRYLIMQGMKNIRNIGLMSILKVNDKLKEPVTSQTIGFTLAPSINGTMRLDKIEYVIKLLLEDDALVAYNIAKDIKKFNDQRKAEQKEIVERYLSHYVNPDNKVVVVIDKDASKGYNGLVATTLAEKFKRPAIVMHVNQDGECAGSFRAYGDFKMKKFLVSNFKFGKYANTIKYAVGHEQAGGIGVHVSNLNALVSGMNAELANVHFDTDLEYDLEIAADDLTTSFIQQVEKFNFLTGKGFPTATFKVTGCTVLKRDVLGKERKDTVKITCDNNLALMKFRTDSDWGLDIIDEDAWVNTVDVIGQLNVNVFVTRSGRRVTNQVFVEDYKKV